MSERWVKKEPVAWKGRVVKRIIRVAGVIVALLSAVSGGYLAGRKSVKPVYQDTFYATMEEIRDSSVWRGVPITMDDLRKGDLISVTYTGMVAEISPALINEVVQIQYLGDELDHAPAGRQVQ